MDSQLDYRPTEVGEDDVAAGLAALSRHQRHTPVGVRFLHSFSFWAGKRLAANLTSVSGKVSPGISAEVLGGRNSGALLLQVNSDL